MSRFTHAADDAPFYRLPKALGGRGFPAYRAYDDTVVLDVEGELYTFKADQVTLIAPPEGLPDWATGVLLAVLKHEDEHGDHREGWQCFAGVLEKMPTEAEEYFRYLLTIPPPANGW